MNAHKPTTSTWKKQKERGSLLGMRTIFFIYRLLGEQICKIILAPVLYYFYISNRQVRANLLSFYRKVNSHNAENTGSPLHNIMYFGFGIVDRLGMWLGRFDTQRLHKHNEQVFYNHINAGKGALIFSSHLGNFELSRAAGRAHLPITMNVIVDIENAQKINTMMESINKDFLIDIIPVATINMTLAIQLKEKVDAGEIVVIAADRVNSLSDNASITLPFLGTPACFPIGPYVLAKVLACPIFSIYCFSAGKGNYDVYFHKLFEQVTFERTNRNINIEKYAQQYTQQLEKYCRRYPSQWYNFYDFWNENTIKE